MGGPIRDPRTPDHARETAERLARERDRRHAQDTPEGRLAEELRTELFGDRRFPGDSGRLGRLEDEVKQLRRQNVWILTFLFTGLVAFVVDILVRVVH